MRYSRNQLEALIGQINDSGYGLTLGVHTRIDETIAQVTGSAKVGNLYVNRNMVGAVVGVQPFGGEGLSGTGPKAGGPMYLYRLLASRPETALATTLARQDAGQVVDTQLKTLLEKPLDRAAGLAVKSSGTVGAQQAVQRTGAGRNPTRAAGANRRA
ncbi:Bifunctional protein putA [Kluyvera cryocrescens]|uniref:Bifunctional protein putA n=1 Tax=Kluyvera cryocrescens TaxID=580 RepID=A0A485CDJ7_KLUCR|nr:Bifunctional protein putA [Kluyvera cryocrescens]